MVRNIILISIDNLRYDCVGYQKDKDELKRFNCLELLETPTIDQISSNSICFTNAFSASTYTSSAHASLFTGLYPPNHGIREPFKRKFNKNVKTLAEILKDKGYSTIMATDFPKLFVALNLPKGFDIVIEKSDNKLFSELEKIKKEKKFIFIHFFDVHEPYMFSECPPDEKYNEEYYQLIDSLKMKQENIVKSLFRALRNYSSQDAMQKKPYRIWFDLWNKIGRPIHQMLPVYIKGVTKFDKGRFNIFWDRLRRLGLLEDSLVVILSDHGEGRCISNQKEFFGHAGELFDNVIRIPLIIRHPDLSHSYQNNLVSIVDVMPTIMEIIGIRNEKYDYEIDGFPFGRERTSIYSEVWSAQKIGYFYETDEGSNRSPWESIDTPWLLVQRCIRTENKKYILWGRQEAILKDDLFKLSNEEFLKLLYRSILNRWEDEKGLNAYLRALEKGVLSKEKVLNVFLGSEEFKSKPKMTIVDLINDPHEDNPYFPLNLKDFLDYGQHLQMIFDIVKVDISEEILISQAEKNETLKRLKDLGYF